MDDIMVTRTIYHSEPTPLDTALNLYANGFFPMSDTKTSPYYAWFFYAERGILPLSEFQPSRSLRKACKKFDVTFDKAFDAVISACAGEGVESREDSWISPPIIELSKRLHRAGYAHSVETWQKGKLVGGLYGVAQGGVFFGESMFSRANNASKVALVCLVEHLRCQSFQLLDMQELSPHTESLGGILISAEEFKKKLEQAIIQDVSWGPCSAHRLQNAYPGSDR